MTRRAASDAADRLFLETTRRFAPTRLARDDVRTALRLVQVAQDKPVADLGCGYGRHLAELALAGYAPIGIDRSPLLLREAARTGARLVRADLRALPLHASSLSAAFCFYSSMFLGTPEDAHAALAEVARVLRPSGSLVLTTDNPVRLAARPVAHFEEYVPGLGRVVEQSTFDAATQVDTVTKELRRPGGEFLSATFVIRYYAPPELAALAQAAGLQLARLEPDGPLTEAVPQLVALLEKREQ
jgi:SAM-dependent methyltransferase